MTIAKGNKRLPIVLSPEAQEDLAEMKKKYGKSQSKIGQIAPYYLSLSGNEEISVSNQEWMPVLEIMTERKKS